MPNVPKLRLLTCAVCPCRYVAGELKPEEFAERLQELVDKHSVIIAFECPPPAEDAPFSPGETSSDSVFVKPNGKRGAPGDAAKGRGGKAAKRGKAAVSAAAGGSPPAAGNVKKRKNNGGGGHEGLPPRMQAKSRGDAGGGKLLKGVLTPVVPGQVKDEDTVGEDNSAWDALLSVCAAMPRQKTK